MVDNFCVKTASIWQFVGYGLFALKILIPVVIIVFGIIDFSKAVVSSDEKAVSKAATSLVQRFILGLVVFFIPTIVSVIIGLVTDVTNTKKSIEACEKCLLDPLGKCDDLKE